VKGMGANGTVKDDDVGDEDNAGKFFAVELIRRSMGQQR
jgi:hypothetical protein